MRFILRAVLAVPLSLALAWSVVSTASAAPTAVYRPAVTVQDVYLSGNGRTLHWRVRTSLTPIRGQARRGTCRNFRLTVRTVPQGRVRPLMGIQRVRARGCWRGRQWSWRGWQDLAYLNVTPGTAHVYFIVPGSRQRWLAQVRPGT